MNPVKSTHSLAVNQLSSTAFEPYGQVIQATSDGHQFGPEDAQLKLDAGIPRFYIMGLNYRGLQFDRITRHQLCTQCLGALGGKSWLIAVAPPSLESCPNIDQLKAFLIPGNCFIKLDVGTWHAGPYFTDDRVDFYNLELNDTNIVDHDTCNLAAEFGLTFTFSLD